MTRQLTNLIEVDGSETYGGDDRPEGAATWNIDRYEDAVERTLERISSNPVGALVISYLTRPVRILPWDDLAEALAYTRPVHLRAGFVAGERIWWCSNQPCAPSERRNMGRGTGAGTNVVIALTPQSWPRAPGRVPADEVLCHELVHAMQHGLGLTSWRWLPHYDDFSEFCAITVTNMYRSYFYGSRATLRLHHRRRGVLRSDPFPARDATDHIYRFGPSAWNDMEWRMLDRFRKHQFAFTESLHAMPPSMCPYNPFRDQAAERATGSLRSLGQWGPPRRVER